MQHITKQDDRQAIEQATERYIAKGGVIHTGKRNEHGKPMQVPNLEPSNA